VSRRQSERGSRFQAEIENGVRVAAMAFRDDDSEVSVKTVVRLWWRSGLRSRRFAKLVRQAREVTQVRVSLGLVKRGQAGRREAMPYFLAVLQDLVNRDPRSRSPAPASGEATSAGVTNIPREQRNNFHRAAKDSYPS